MTEPLTPKEVNEYRRIPVAQRGTFRYSDLVATIDALAEALRATENWRASGKLYSKEREAIARVAAWLE